MDGTNNALCFLGTEPLDANDEGEIPVDVQDDDDFNQQGSDADDDMVYENPQTGERSLMRLNSAPLQANETPHRVRVVGGTAPVHKRVGKGYNSDDERLYQLKQQGYTDDYVANKLVDEGRIRYLPKSISSRFLRIRRLKQKVVDDKLDDELSDWHEGEDDILENTVAAIKTKYDHEHAKVEEKKWNTVADMVAGVLGKKKYTGKACLERWNNLQDQTALPPIEHDPDQEGRRILREARIAHNKEEREKLKEAEEKGNGKDIYATERQAEKLERLREAQAKKDARAAEKAEEKCLKEEKAAGRIQQKTDQEEANALWVAGIARMRETREKEEIVYRYFTNGKPLRRMRNMTWKDWEKGIDLVSESEDDDEVVIVESSDEVSDGHEADNEDNLNNITSTPAKTQRAKVTSKTLLNPRSIMTMAELKNILAERGLPAPGANETHPRVVARLAAADAAARSDTLSTLLSKHFDKRKGNREDKAVRLQQHDANKSIAGEKGVRPTDLDFKRSYEGYQGKFARLIPREIEEN